MNLNSENRQVIHEVLLTDLQRRIFKQYNERTSEFLRTDEDYDVTQELLVNKVLHTNSIADINDVLIEYRDLLPDEYLTLDGTLNYVIALLAK